MKTDEQLLQDVILYLDNLAELRSSNEERGILTGNRLVKEWDIYDRVYKHHVSACLSNLAHKLETAHEQGSYEDNTTNAIKVFKYVFDKSFDLAYITISPTGEKVSFDIEGIGNDYEHIIPPYLQNIVKKNVLKIELIGKDMYEFMKFEGHMKLPFHKWMFFYMCAANTLALSFLLEQDLKIIVSLYN